MKCFLQKESGAFLTITWNKSQKNEMKKCLFVTGEKIKKETDLPYRKSGCAALDMAYVAAGRYDG